MLEKPEGAIRNDQSRDTGNIDHKTQNENKQNHNKKHKTTTKHTTQHRKLIRCVARIPANRGLIYAREINQFPFRIIRRLRYS